MEPARLVRLSKYLSKHLRHAPERIGLTLAPGGWVEVSTLLVACAKGGVAMTRAELEEVVAQNDKQRFSFDPSGQRLRANQGHTTEVDLQLAIAEPPAVLFHGTGARSVDAILSAGLLRMARHHVHLSADSETARRVGARHGRPVVLVVDAARMRADGHTFSRSDNGVWLVDHVPPGYLSRADR